VSTVLLGAAVWRCIIIKALLKLEEEEPAEVSKNVIVKAIPPSAKYVEHLKRCERYRKEKTWNNLLALHLEWEVWGLTYGLFMVNLIVTTALNVGYVVSQLRPDVDNSSKYIIQISTAIIKVFWNFIVLRSCTDAIVAYKGMKHLIHHQSHNLQLSINSK
jgi:hypothetical protein